MGGNLPGSEQDTYHKAMSQLNRLAGRAWFVLAVERLWPVLWPPIGVALLFLSVSWLGLWLVLPGTIRLVLLAGFALGFLYSLKGFLSFRRPQVEDTLRRIDRDSGARHGQAETFIDKLALSRETAATQELWILHRKQAAATIPAMRVARPHPDMPRRDRYAIRAGVILTVIASAFIAGPEKSERLEAAFRGFGFTAGENAQQLADGWITPPNYTGLPPQIISFTEEQKTLLAPVDSSVVIRSQKGGGAEITTEAGLKQEGAAAKQSVKSSQDKLEEHRFTLEGNARLTLRSGMFGKAQLDIEAIPDTPPVIAFEGEPSTNNRGVISLAFSGSDDYGIIELKGATRLAVPNRALVPPPEFSLTPPAMSDANKPLRQTVDLTDHPLAGLPVELTLIARDGAGQEGRSQTITFTLPERPFTVPLARALVELRQKLVLNPDNRPMVLIGIDALLIAPAKFTPQWGVYLGLRQVSRLLRRARSSGDLLAVSDWLWAMAVQIEDGSLPEAERNLKDAQQKLQDAVERGASDREIAQLSEALREAMNRYLQELGQRMAQEGQQTADMPPADMTINSEDLARMLDKFEQLMRDGKTAEAQQLLDQLRNIFDSLQMGRPNNRMTDPMAREMAQAMKDANRLLHEQRRLRDGTYDRDRKQQLYGEGEQQGDEQSLDQRQQALRQQLQELQRKMRGIGLEAEQGMEEAEQAMGEAEQALKENQGDQAVDAQGRAIDALQRGAQDMAQQGRQMMGNSRPQNGNRPDPEGNGTVSDPTGKAHTPGSRERARQLMEQLRNKLSDPTRPKDELDYFERLLRQDR